MNFSSLSEKIDLKCKDLENFFLNNGFFGKPNEDSFIITASIQESDDLSSVIITVNLEFILKTTLEKLKIENNLKKLPVWIYEKINLELYDYFIYFDKASIKMSNGPVYIIKDVFSNSDKIWYYNYLDSKTGQIYHREK